MVKIDEMKDNLKLGKLLASPDEGEEIVLSGLSGMFPDSDNVKEFENALLSKKELISDDNRRWSLKHPEIPHRTGKVNNINKFDASFFGLHYKAAQAMDPMCRLLLEKTFEAVVDAGYNPSEFEGKNVGVYIGACFSETEKKLFYELLEPSGFGVTGCARVMLSSRIGYWLKVNGPCYIIDTACSSSLYAFEHAYKAIREGICEAAIVGGCNVCLHPFVNLQFARLGVLSPDGRCKCFDESANGYCRSEAVCVALLEKKKNCKRMYCTVIHAKTNCDGYKEQGITYPAGPLQEKLLEEFYEECEIDASSIDWLEAHGTGTKVGDPEEVNAIESVFCKNQKSPFYIGSVKSNIGHSEPASGLCSITKVIIAMERGLIPPNINLTKLRSDIPAFNADKIRVITEVKPWKGGIVGVNSFGFGGANCHVLLKFNEKQKINNGFPDDNLPRLVTISGRSIKSIEYILNELEEMPIDVELIKLFHEVFKTEVINHNVRGFTILNAGKSINEVEICNEKKPILFNISGIGFKFIKQLRFFINFPTFSKTFQCLHEIMLNYQLDLLALFNGDKEINENFVTTAVFTTAFQISLITLLEDIGIFADYVVTESFGEVIGAFATGYLTAKEAILAVYHIAIILQKNNNYPGVMEYIELPYSTLKNIVTSDIDFIFQGEKSCIISGSEKTVKQLIVKLKQINANIYISELFTNGIVIHNSSIAHLEKKIFNELNKIITSNETRKEIKSHKSIWITLTNTPRTSNIAQNIVRSILSKMSFNEFEHVTKKATVLNFNTISLVKDNVKSHKNYFNFLGLVDSNQTYCLTSFLNVLGELYIDGVDFDCSKLYPNVSLPVSRRTPMISNFIKWYHDEDWFVPSYKHKKKLACNERIVHISMKDEEYEFTSGHVIDKRILFPATAYLFLVWETMAQIQALHHTDVPVVLEHVRFLRATNLSKEGITTFSVMIEKNTGKFEIIEGGASIVTGTVHLHENTDNESCQLIDKLEDFDDSQETVKFSSNDIYKEFRLRGYNYNGLFRSLISANYDGTKGKIMWHHQWIPFMDNMLQIQLINKDTRGLFVPTSIEKVFIDPKKHIEMIENIKSDEKVLTVHYFPHCNVILSGGIEIFNMCASAIARKKIMADPVIEKYEFVKYSEINTCQENPYDMQSIVRIFSHIVLENSGIMKIKVLEIGDVVNNEKEPFLADHVYTLLKDLPLIEPDICLITNIHNSCFDNYSTEIVIEDKKIPKDNSITMVIATDVFGNPEKKLLDACLKALIPNGYLITRESLNTNCECELTDFVHCSQFICENEKMILLRKNQKSFNSRSISIKVSNNDFSWITLVQDALKSFENDRIVLYSREPTSGIIGLVNCLRKEQFGDKIRCVLIFDETAPNFSLTDQFYVDQLKKDLVINVFKNNQWGSYRHLPLSNETVVDALHTYVHFSVRGDLSSGTWVVGELNNNFKIKNGKVLVNIYYSSLNFRDVMTASGKLSPEILVKSRFDLDCIQGFEFTGRLQNGKKVMGLSNCKSMATKIAVDEVNLWEVPEYMSLEEAATIPVVYGTVLYSIYRCGFNRGETILIHSGTGGIGQAAINIATYFGLEIYTTVGNKEKREFLKNMFPQIDDSHIGNSRDTSFEQLIMKQTNGRGIDIILNSLAEEKLYASVRCLAKGGRFLEIGKFDLANNSALGLEFMAKNATYYGVALDHLIGDMKLWHNLWIVFEETKNAGVLKPLNRTVFNYDQVEQAYRFMSTGKHTGKVIMKIRDEEPEKNICSVDLYKPGKPRFYANPDKSYIIAGGLGGFGLEIADWLILRGAKFVVLSSRTGVKNGYAQSRINIFRSYDVVVEVVTDDITTYNGVESVIEKSNKLAPVGGIFNLAVVLKDDFFENHTQDDFVVSLKPKALATEYFDIISREKCPKLDQFVCFSSVSCGRGNLGQANYGMANSIMEKICELRKSDGFPGLAIQWGAIGEVGLVAEMQDTNRELVIGGTLQQKIASCTEILDTFLTTVNSAVVSSMIVAEKKAGIADNIIDTVANILGLRELKSVSLHSTLAELGMDSMMAVEIKQTLENHFEVFLSPQEIRSMTFAKLYEIASKNNSSVNQSTDSEVSENNLLPNIGIKTLVRIIGKESEANYPIVRMQLNSENSSSKNSVLLLPGIEGVGQVFEVFVKNLKMQALSLQYGYKVAYENIEDLAESLVHTTTSLLVPGQPFNIVGYSFGGLVTLELVVKLEQLGYTGQVWLIDSSPDLMINFTKMFFNKSSDETMQIELLLRFIDLFWPQDKTKIEEQLQNLNSWEERIDKLCSDTPSNVDYSTEYLKSITNAIYHRIKSILKYEGLQQKCIKSKVILIRPTESSIPQTAIDENYNLSNNCLQKVDEYIVEGNHVSIIDNCEVAEIINNTCVFEEDAVTLKKPVYQPLNGIDIHDEIKKI